MFGRKKIAERTAEDRCHMVNDTGLGIKFTAIPFTLDDYSVSIGLTDEERERQEGLNADPMIAYTANDTDYDVKAEIEPFDRRFMHSSLCRLRITSVTPKTDKVQEDAEQREQDGHGRVECKRCGVVYRPRCSSDVDWFTDLGPVFKADGGLLIRSVNPQDYCPRCEEHLMGVREYLLECLKKKPVGDKG